MGNFPTNCYLMDLAASEDLASLHYLISSYKMLSFQFLGTFAFISCYFSMINNFLSSTIWLSLNTICLKKSGSKWNSFPVLFRVMKMYPSNFQRWPIDFEGFSHLKSHGTSGLFVIGLISVHCSDYSFWCSNYPIYGSCSSDPNPGWHQFPGCQILHFSCPSMENNYLPKQGFLLVGKCLGNLSLSVSESPLLLILQKNRAGKHGLFREKKFTLIFLIQVEYNTLFS